MANIWGALILGLFPKSGSSSHCPIEISGRGMIHKMGSRAHARADGLHGPHIMPIEVMRGGLWGVNSKQPAEAGRRLMMLLPSTDAACCTVQALKSKGGLRHVLFVQCLDWGTVAGRVTPHGVNSN